jgi:hypothetical protein
MACAQATSPYSLSRIQLKHRDECRQWRTLSRASEGLPSYKVGMPIGPPVMVQNTVVSNMRRGSNRLIGSGRHWLMAASIAGHWCASGIHRRTLDSTESQWQKSHWIPSNFAGFRRFSSNVSASILTSLAAEALCHGILNILTLLVNWMQSPFVWIFSL